MRALVTMSFLGISWSMAAAGPLDEPSFTATPAALLAAARPLAGNDAPVVMLRDELTVTLDERGRATKRYRMVGLITRPAGVDDWGTFFVGWSPFYQDKPQVRARVITPDGKVAELDASLIRDQPAQSESAVIFSDRREMQAPLPRLSVGAIFEEEFVITDREPELEAGTVHREYVGRGVPVERNLIVIDAPAKLPVRVVTRALDKAAPRKESRGGRTVWTYDFAKLPPLPSGQAGIPPDQTAFGYVGFATAPSWAAVAAGYDRLVAARLAEPFTAPAGLTGATPRATVDLSLAWLHANVRYTGIELDDSAIIPFPPAQTVSRGFGDCKDKATLLVALLRAAKIEANLALLDTGPGSDLDRDLPGMGNFDHAIVRARIGGKDLWIDATEDGLPAGQLPVRDQGRRVLIVAPGTKDLITTPIGAAADNLVREVRTYQLAETGASRVTEVTREHGVFQNNLRRWSRDTSTADLTKNLSTYVEREYVGKLVSFRGSVPAKVTDPFELTVEVSGSRRATTDRVQAEIYLHATDTLERLTDTFTDGDAAIGPAMEKRTLDYQWTTPHVYEIENRLVLPPGYQAPALTAREERKLGTMILTTTRRVESGALVITYRLDTGKVRITAAELRATRAAVQAMYKEEGEHVLIAQTGAALMEQGKMREAIAEYKRLIALHPREALHHGQLAEAYRRAGLNPAARRAAKQGVDIEPTSGDAHVMLAFHLIRDSVGRELGYDADRAAGLAAYRKALTLEPTHLGAMHDLAWLLGVDARGWVNTSPAELREAAALRRRANERTANAADLVTEVELLLWAGDFAAAETAARALPASDDRASLLVAAVAAGKNPRDAVALATSLGSGDARTRIINGARARLYQLRRYDAMRVLHAEIAASSDATQNHLMKTIVAVDPAKLAPADPATPVKLAMMTFFDLTPPATPWSKAMAAELDELAAVAARGPDAQSVRIMPPAVAIDAVIATLPMTVTGDAASGWRVELDAKGQRMAFHVVRGARGAELVAIGDLPSGFGRQIKAALAKKDLAAAARWVKRAVDDSPSHPAVVAVGKLFADEVSATRPATRDLFEVAAALMVVSSDATAAIPVLERCPVNHAATRQACRTALLWALGMRKAWNKLPAVARQLPATTPDEIALRAEFLALGGDTAEAVTIVDDALRGHPDDENLLLKRAMLAIAIDGWAKAQPALGRVEALRNLSADSLNNLAWTRVFHDATADRALALGARAERAASPLEPELANTLAVIEAEAGHPDRALFYLGKSHPRRLSEPPASADWYVIGRIAETYGLRDDAIAAYRRVEDGPAGLGVPSAYDFARRALTRLGAP